MDAFEKSDKNWNFLRNTIFQKDKYYLSCVQDAITQIRRDPNRLDIPQKRIRTLSLGISQKLKDKPDPIVIVEPDSSKTPKKPVTYIETSDLTLSLQKAGRIYEDLDLKRKRTAMLPMTTCFLKQSKNSSISVNSSLPAPTSTRATKRDLSESSLAQLR